jgi:hypothetical protein
MNTHSIKLSLVDWLLQSDEKTLLKVDKIRKNTKIAEASFQPMTKQELVKRALESENDIAHARVTSLENLEDEIKNW